MITGGELNGSLSNDQLNNGYTIPTNDEYTITYYTNVADVAEGTVVGNTVKVSKGDKEKDAHAGVTVNHRDWSFTKSTSTGRSELEATSQQITWDVDVTLPDKVWTEMEYSDVIKDADGFEGSHYGTVKAMNDQLTSSLQDDSMVSYKIYYYSDTEQTTLVAQKENGNLSYSEDCGESTKVKSFKIVFAPAEGVAIREYQGQKVSFNYNTTADYKDIENAGEYKFTNTGTLNNVSHDATYTYNKIKIEKPTLSKQSGVKSETNVNYQEGSTTVRYVQNGNKLYYRLAINYNVDTLTEAAKNETLIITDTLPKGASYCEEADIQYGYQYSWGTNGFWGTRPDVKITKDEATGEQTLKITCPPNVWLKIDKDNIATAFYIYYTVTLDDWDGKDKDIVNKASINNKDEVSQTTTVVDSKDFVSKQGVQYDINGNEIEIDSNGNIIGNVTPSNRVKYAVVINPEGKTLNEGGKLTLTDSLTTNDDMAAYLDAASIALYYYDPFEADHKGAAVDTSFFTVSYKKDSSGKYVMTILIPDSTPFVLEYEYSFDLSGYTSPTVSNSVSLNGQTSKKDNWQLKKATASGEVDQVRVSITKVDEDDITRTLSGAVFKVEYFKVYEIDANGKVNWLDQCAWTTVSETVRTDANGKIVFDSTLPRDSELKLYPGCIYRLTEIQPPAGYRQQMSGQYYFAARSGISTLCTDEQIFNYAHGKGFTGADKHNIEFIGETGGSFRITNKACDVAVRKIWQDHNGYEIENSSESVKVQLYKKTDINSTASEAVGEPVELNAGNDWTYIWKNLAEAYYTVKEVGENENIYITSKDQVSYDVIYNNNNGISAGEITVINRCKVQNVDLTVEKLWKDKDGSTDITPQGIENITFTLYEDETPIGTYVLGSNSFTANENCRYKTVEVP